MTSVGSSRSSNQATGVSKSRGLARPFDADRPKLGQAERQAVILGDIAARFAFEQLDPELHAARNDGDRAGRDFHPAKLGLRCAARPAAE